MGFLIWPIKTNWIQIPKKKNMPILGDNTDPEQIDGPLNKF